MILSSHDLRTLKSGSTVMIHARQSLARLRSQSAAILRKHARRPANSWRRVGLLGALALGLTSGVAAAQSLVTTLTCGPNPQGIAVNPTTNMIYVSDIDVGTLTVINGAANTASTLNTGEPNITAVAINATTNTVYALYEGSQSTSAPITVTPGKVVVIDGTSNTVTKTIALPDLGTHIAVNPVTNTIYVSTVSGIGNGASANVRVIDGTSDTITTSISIPEVISEVAVDATRNLVYATHINEPGNGTLAVIDGATNAVKATVPLGYDDNIFVINEPTNTLYSPDAHDNKIYVIAGATDSVTTTVPVPAPLQPLELAVNSVTDKVYVTVSNTSNGASTLQVLDGSTNLLSGSIALPAGNPYATQILVNSVTNKIWLTTSPVTVIDGVSNAATSVTGTSATINVGALNTATNYAYLAGPNTVYVISGAVAGPAFSAAPSPLAFGNQTEGTTSGAMTLTVTNTGTTGLSISSVMLGGTDMTDFPVATDACIGATVAAGKTCTVSVSFSPSTTAGESATLTFTDNAADSPQAVMLTGKGVAPVATASTTTLSASATSVAVGSSVTLTASVSPASGTPTPTGSVDFKEGSTTLCTSALNGSGAATCATSGLAIGMHSIAASYNGDSRNLASTSSPLTVTVAAAASTTSLTASASSIVVGASLTFTATVQGAAGALSPTGTVVFKDGTTSLGSSPLNGSGVATLSTTALVAGSHTVTAAYAGDVNNAASTSSGVSVSVWSGSADFTLALSPSSGSVAVGKNTAVTITLTSVNGFNAATSLTCAGLPKNTTCSFSSSPLTPSVSGTATSTVTIQTDTKAATALDRAPSGLRPEREDRSGTRIALAGLGVIFLLWPGFGRRRLQRIRSLLGVIVFAIFALASLGGISACGGGPTTPKGNYSIQITATAGSISHAATYSLTVQ